MTPDAAFAYALFLVAGIGIVALIWDAGRRYGWREAVQWAAGFGLVIFGFIAWTAR